MKKLYKAAFLLIFAATFSFVGWTNFDGSESAQLTNFYFYKNQPFYLTPKTDMVFIKFSKTTDKISLENVIKDFPQVTNVSDFNFNDDRGFLKLNTFQSIQRILEIVDRMKSYSELDYVSPVFSPDDGKTLIGCENEIIVQFKTNTNNKDIQSTIEANNLTIVQDLELTGGPSYVFKVPKNSFAIDVANEIFKNGLVNWSEPNLYFTNLLCFIPNDPFFTQQWAELNTGNNIPGGISGTPDCDMDLDTAWNTTLGISQCKIAISDTGVDTLHEDLSSNMIVGSGYDFYNNDPWAYDDYGHGTCCAGIVAAIGNNSIGISGVAPGCKLIPVKWLSSSGNGNYTGAVNATNWSYQHGAWIISNSWGFVGGSSSALDQAITDAATLGRNGKGSLFVVAAGNENGAMRYPANTHPMVLVVGGISPCDQRKSPSSCDLESFWGASYGSNLDIVAPCVKIYATDITGTPGFTTTNYDPTFNGTSSATPNAAGVCALVLSKDSTLTWDSVRAKVDRSAEKRGSYSYTSIGKYAFLGNVWNNEMGYGLINARTVLAILGPPPSLAVNRCLSLPSPGVNTNYVSIPHQPGMVGLTSITIEAWVKIGGNITPNIILNKGASSYDYQLGITAATNNPFFRAQGIIIQATSMSIIPNVWTHLAVTYDGSVVKFYKDGALGYSQSSISPLGNSTNEMRIGRGDIDPYAGKIEELRLWSVARTQGAIDSNKCRKYPVSFTSSTGLKALWHFDSTYVDSISGFNGISLGTTTFDTLTFAIPGANCNLVGIQQVSNTIPSEYNLEQNYPNPFNPVTNIKFSIPRGEFVEIKLFDIAGKEVAVLFSEPLEAGNYNIDYNASNLASGVYFYKITAGDYSAVKKMMLIK